MDQVIKVNKDIELRVPSPDIASDKYEATIKSRDHLLPWLTWVHIYESAKTKKEGVELRRTFQIQKAEEFRKGINYAYDIYYRGSFAGSIELLRIARNENYCDIGYWLSDDYVGKGIMTQSVKAIVKEAFEKLKMHCVVINSAEENKGSRAVAERCGFKLEAILQDRLYLDGKYYNKCIYTRINPEE